MQCQRNWSDFEGSVKALTKRWNKDVYKWNGQVGERYTRSLVRGCGPPLPELKDTLEIDVLTRERDLHRGLLRRWARPLTTPRAVYRNLQDTLNTTWERIVNKRCEKIAC